MLNENLTRSKISKWLRETDREKLTELYDVADRTRRKRVGDEVWLRGLIELSNYCRRDCLYCGARASRRAERYRMTREEILESAKLARDYQFGTVVLQAGEDFALDEAFVADLIQEIRERYQLAITLSLGERKDSEFVRWKEAGADRYLLRFETSNRDLYDAIHPTAEGSVFQDRIEMLKRLREIGYEIGSGVMIGVPGQSFDDLANDLALFRELDLDMIGCGPFLPHAETPLGRIEARNGEWRTVSIHGTTSEDQRGISLSTDKSFKYPTTDGQAPNDIETAFKVVALARILCPDANIPSTTAVATIDETGGRKGALERGANVVMPNLTPKKYRRLYDIYPNKAAAREEAEKTRQTVLKQIREIGRVPGIGSGSSPRFLKRRA